MTTILGIDPGTKYMGVAAIRGDVLLAAGVHTLRNGERPYDVVGQARRIVLSYIAEHTPAIVGIEKPLLRPTKRASLVSVIGDELRARSRELGIQVIELSAREARDSLLGHPQARKLDVATVIVEKHFPELQSRLPKRPRRSALGFNHKDRYWLHMFDAIAVALAVRRSRE